MGAADNSTLTMRDFLLLRVHCGVNAVLSNVVMYIRRIVMKLVNNHGLDALQGARDDHIADKLQIYYNSGLIQNSRT
jgi:hypothetical protein